MADIDVVKGRSSNWLWWVIAAVIIALLLVFMMRGRHETAPAGAPRSSSLPAAALAMPAA